MSNQGGSADSRQYSSYDLRTGSIYAYRWGNLSNRGNQDQSVFMEVLSLDVGRRAPRRSQNPAPLTCRLERHKGKVTLNFKQEEMKEGLNAIWSVLLHFIQGFSISCRVVGMHLCRYRECWCRDRKCWVGRMLQKKKQHHRQPAPFRSRSNLFCRSIRLTCTYLPFIFLYISAPWSISYLRQATDIE